MITPLKSLVNFLYLKNKSILNIFIYAKINILSLGKENMAKIKTKEKSKILFFSITLIVLLVTSIFLINKTNYLYKIQSLFLRNEQAIEFKKSNESFHVKQYILSEEKDWQQEQSLLLINKDHPLPEDFSADLAEYRDSGVLMNRAILEAYGRLSDAVLNQVYDKMYVSSVYRSIEEQAAIFEEMPEDALPAGYSEHHTGLALDLYVAQFAGPAFLESQAGQFVNKNCSEFGFIIRYSEGKEDITGIPFEPWHIRYVGLPHAKIISQNYLSLEEYIESLEPGKFYVSGNYIISRQSLSSPIELPADLTNIVYSYDNTGYIILTGQFEK